jgi:hypothetical protein
LGSEWSVKFKEVLEKTFRVKKGMKRIDYQKPPPEVRENEREVDQLLSTDHSGFHRKLQGFIKRLIKQRESILTFYSMREYRQTTMCLKEVYGKRRLR